MDRLEFRSIPTVNGHQIGKFDPKYDFLLLEEPNGFEGDDQPRWQVGDKEYRSKWEGQQLRVSETAFRKSGFPERRGVPPLNPQRSGRAKRSDNEQKGGGIKVSFSSVLDLIEKNITENKEKKWNGKNNRTIRSQNRKRKYHNK
jgi:hypothetical protein